MSDARWEIWQRTYERDYKRTSEYSDEELEALDALSCLGENNSSQDAARAFMDYFGKLTPKGRKLFLKTVDEPQETLAI